MALGLTLNAKLRASPYTASVHGFVAERGFHTGTSPVGGLADDTELSACLDRSSVVIARGISPSPSARAGAGVGTPEATRFRLKRRLLGFDALAGLIGNEFKGFTATLWETGTLGDGVTYTMASPKIWERGPVATWDLGSEEATGTIQAAPVGPSSPALDRYRGWGTGLEYDGATAFVAWEAWNPSGDFSFSALAMLPYEKWDSTWTGVIMGNTECQIRFTNRHVDAFITHATSGLQLIIGPDLPRPERWCMVRAVYTSSTKVFELFVDGVSAGSVTGVGARTDTGSTWRFGSTPAGANFFHGIAGEYRLFDGGVTTATLDEQERGPLVGDETDLYAYLPGWPDIAGTGLLDYAQVNAASPKDGTITAATRATMCGGNLREASDDATGQIGVEGRQMQWPLGRARHVLCVPIDNPQTDVHDGIFQVCNPQQGIQDFETVYEGGVALSITHRVTSWLALYAVTLAGPGDCAVYPQGGAVMLHTRTSGAITADVAGGGPWVRGLSFDGVNDYVDFGTAPNSILNGSFSLRLVLDAEPSTVGQILSNIPASGLLGILVQTLINVQGSAITFTLASTATPQSVSKIFAPGARITGTFLWVVDSVGATQVLYWDGGEVSNNSRGTIGAASSQALNMGRSSFFAASYWDGTVSEFAIYSEVKDIAWHQRNLHRAQITRLDAGGVAIDESGGLVSLPAENHGHVAGESVDITGTTNYNATETLHANTTTDRLWITATYNAETFDGFSESVIDSALEHYYPGSTWDFDASTLADEGVASAADGTLTGGTWVGGVAPTSPRSLVTYVAKAGGQPHVDIDLTKTYDWPGDPLDWSRRTGSGGSQVSDPRYLGILDELLMSLDGWRSYDPEAVLILGWIEAPEDQVADWELTAKDAKGREREYQRITGSEPPREIEVEYAQISHPEQPGELAGAVETDRGRWQDPLRTVKRSVPGADEIYLLSPREPYRVAARWSTLSGALTEVQRLRDRVTRRENFREVLGGDEWLYSAIAPGDYVSAEHPRAPNGTATAMLISVRWKLGSSEVEIVGWGVESE